MEQKSFSRRCLLSTASFCFVLFFFLLQQSLTLGLRLSAQIIKHINANVCSAGEGVASSQMAVIAFKAPSAVNLADIYLCLPSTQQQGNNFIKPHLLDNWSFKMASSCQRMAIQQAAGRKMRGERERQGGGEENNKCPF